jgi:hypothetical protein
MYNTHKLYVRDIGNRLTGVFTRDRISAGEEIEACLWLPVTQRMEILIKKNDPELAKNIFPNPDGIQKEREILARFAELDLQERLDRGLITTDQFKAILQETASPEKMLNIVSHAILLGFGSIYRTSDRPNITWEYDSSQKLYKFIAVEDINSNTELTYFSK